MINYKIRQINPDEIHLLEDFIYEAIFIPEGVVPPPRSIIFNPDIYVYIEDFEKPDDHCLVAESDGKIAGAVWVRILSGPVKGFGNIDDESPEFAISLYPKYRGMGIGTNLMKSMLSLLREKGYKRTSLAVQKDNYAVKMYQNVGFVIAKELDEEYLMICELG